jgi:hypothetical protein
MPKLKAYVGLEATVAATIAAGWTKRARPIMAKLETLLEAGRFDEARELAWAISLDGIASAQRNRLEELAVSALLLGASRLVPMKQTALMTGALPLPYLLQPAIDQFIRIIEHAAVQVRATTLRLIEREEQAARRTAELTKADKHTLADKLNAAVLGTGEGLIAAGANATTSRLVSYGFLSQAQESGIAAYQVTEVLDAVICPVCLVMHGKTFEVAREHAKLEQVLQLQDPEALKTAAPWPKQDDASVKVPRSLSEAEIQARGWGSPPYHPLCRGQLVPLGTVEEMVPVQELVVEQEVAPPPQI